MRATRRELLAALAAGAIVRRPVEATRSRPVSRAATATDRFAWFDEARFGLFVHWGACSVAGVEASWPLMVPELRRVLPQPAITEDEYWALAERFDPQRFDPKEWVRLARSAGMRYVILTSKHHDGFCLFDAPGTDYKTTSTAAGRDLCAELAEACSDEGLRLGFYFSPPDMHDPGYRDTSRPVATNWTGEPERPEWSAFLDRMEAQLRKLLTDYGDISVLWFDGLFEHDRYDPERMTGVVRELSPSTLINDRLGPGDYVTPEQFFPSGIPVRSESPPAQVTEEALLGFFDLLLSDRPPEEIENLLAFAQRSRYPTKLRPAPDEVARWETCLTMNRTWAYNPTDTEWKSSEALIRTLIEVVSRHGNLLLNVGPRPDGTFPPQAVERLEAIGRFMQANAASIHGASWGPVQGHEQVRSTARDGRVYLHVLGDVNEVEIDGYDRSVSAVRELSSGVECRFSLDGGVLRLRPPERSGDATGPRVFVVES